ncbi:similar to sigma-E regulatory protein [gamma proteobacterium HdN1]|nr:similar to sigma-E regulatory protein [gamma proteobacterium HdN1]
MSVLFRMGGLVRSRHFFTVPDAVLRVCAVTALSGLGWVSFPSQVGAAVADVSTAGASVTEKSEPVLAQPRAPEQWLKAMSEAARTLSFKARSMYLSGDQLTTVEILRGKVNGEEWERVLQLGGEPAELICRGDHVVRLQLKGAVDPETGGSRKDSYAVQGEYTVQDKISMERRSFGAASSVLNTQQYRLALGPRERVAGRLAQRIDLLPVDRYRYGLHVWADVASSLLLKSIIVDSSGQALDMLEFVDIQINPELTLADFDPVGRVQAAISSGSSPSLTANQEARDASASAGADQSGQWQIGWLPDGFQAVSHAAALTAPQGYTQAYSDGVATFTLFVEPIADTDLMEGTRQHGATVAVSFRAASPRQHWRITVVGEVPMETAMHIASSVRPLQASQ